MNKTDFFFFHQIKNHIWVWLNGECSRLKLDEFLALPDNISFNIEGSGNNYQIVSNNIKIL